MSFVPPKGDIIDLNGIDMARLDQMLLDETGRMKLLSYEDYRSLSVLELQAWGNLRGRYGFPTLELVQWLKEQIGGRSALEIGAGFGDLGHHLGIRMTDSYQQVKDPETVAHIVAYGLQPTQPPADVIEEDAESAVRHYKPDVVVASWVTQKYDPRDHFGGGNYLGVRHEYIIERCKTFILIGNMMVHGLSRALTLPHERLAFPWLVSRAKMQDMNRIWVWQGGKK